MTKADSQPVESAEYSAEPGIAAVITADIYDAIYAYKNYDAEADAILRLAGESLGRQANSLLDMGCGTGKHLARF